MNMEELRLQLRRNGYAVLPNRDKQILKKGWPKLAQTEEEIKSWTRLRRSKATGIRLDNGLAVIDVDVEDEEIAEQLLHIIDVQIDGFDDRPAAIRYNTKNAKLAFFVRTAEPFNRLHTARFGHPDRAGDDPVAHVEIFGGAAPRQFGAYGAHTVNKDGEIEVSYDWYEPIQPLNTPQDELPELTKAQFFEILNVCMKVFNEAGLVPVELSQLGEDFSEQVFDLTDDMEFHCNDGVTRSLEELQAVAGTEGLRCSASWLEGPSAVRTDRCLVNVDHEGRVTVWESASGTTHMETGGELQSDDESLQAAGARILDVLGPAPEKDQAPTVGAGLDPANIRIEGKSPSTGLKLPEAKPQINPDDDFNIVVWKLLRLYAFFPSRSGLTIAPIWGCTGPTDGMAMSAFRDKYLPHHMIEIGPRGGEKKINPVDAWLNAHDKVVVAGIQLRPDMTRPLFVEDGDTFINTYRPPVHEAEGGEVDTFMEFMDHLIPDEDEQNYFLDWLAFKYCNPHIPGPGIVMVARRYGTGRGTLGDILRRLFGERYARDVPFEVLTGKTYQSQYNDWQAGSLLAMVNESMEASGGRAYKARLAAYEALKEKVDPRATLRLITVKGVPSFYAPVFTSVLVFTNHADGVPMSDDDRRFYVITNGDPAPAAFWAVLNEWMKSERNMSALAWLLRNRDTSRYNPYAPPPPTQAKAHMVDAGLSDLDHYIDEAFEQLKGEIYTPKQITQMVARAGSAEDLPPHWRDVVRRETANRGYRIGLVKDGPGWVVKVEGRKYSTFCLTPKLAYKWRQRDTDHHRVELLKNGHPEGRQIGNIVDLTGQSPDKK